MEKMPMTAEGLTQLQKERERLMNVERPEIVRAIGAAREHGDLSENAEYHAARERQSFVEGRLAEIEDIISRAEVIDPSKLTGSTVRFGARVNLVDEETEEENTFQIVGSHEADVSKGRISVTSPLARALIGKQKGDIVEVNAPSGPRSYEILGVRFG
ncbi:transcription elongation factor GreA [Shumkonia mesophila]|uniref:transcription elongation factor GreA n=1 Tax=Shumkonia mesophila TaxID=2838854 RepID=UPI00293454A2|nr:transcription elongation factor GreA [Shumkonia mesophila]